MLFDSSGTRDPTNYGYFSSLIENVRAGSPVLVNLFCIRNSKNETAIRYDRILLLKAEALTKLGRYQDALTILNQIRNRAETSKARLKFANGKPTLAYDKIGRAHV